MPNTMLTPKGLITFRPAVPDDAEALRELRLEGLLNHPEAFGADYETSVLQSVEFWAQRIQRHAAENNGVIYLAAAGEGLVGITGLYCGDSKKGRHNGNIWGVYVRQAWRGHNIADALIEACLAWGKAQGVVVAKLGVATHNPSAIRCYLRCGFSVYGVEPKAIYHNGAYIDELLMAREL
jgi:RimJ/RimL family protein N-acetyltransferase